MIDQVLFGFGAPSLETCIVFEQFGDSVMYIAYIAGRAIADSLGLLQYRIQLDRHQIKLLVMQMHVRFDSDLFAKHLAQVAHNGAFLFLQCPGDVGIDA